ncbi:sulfite exporter TauE/SafE family protein [Rhodoferax sp. U11-2br]|uniref:sulfite exporter TauE/SafE family protein n=1 Tax=Rhodoferax sp. U11-2br TaxID=2838878 RepID=UPI001BEBD477|nr:sulfite exporter TauE/SafE family protein [Rhodoferax sp. U11-2br]MBT3067236.1 sulfite exporter TauE/SafE family protein [Rhodoferax sp. U11-2br]
MHFEPSLILALGLLGLISGFLAGLLGIGGGMIMVPFVTAILSSQGVDPQLSIKMAIATSMATIVFTSVSSLRAHHKRGAIRWDLVKSLAPGIVLGAGIASIGVFAVLKGSTLALVFALFVGFSATQMFLDKKPAPSRSVPGPMGLLGTGSVIGFLSGLVGAGGGFVSVPFMTWCNVPIHAAVATSAALGFPIALANALGFVVSGSGVAQLPPYSLGYIWFPALVVIASCSILTAPLGAAAAHKLPVKRLKRVFASVLYLLATYMLYRAVVSW